MRTFWRKYGLWIEASVLILFIVLMIGYRFWNDEPSKIFIGWFQLVLILSFLIDRVLKIRKRLQKAE